MLERRTMENWAYHWYATSIQENFLGGGQHWIMFHICFIMNFITQNDRCYHKMQHLFYWKLRQIFITKCVKFLVIKCNSFITKCDIYYKVHRYIPDLILINSHKKLNLETPFLLVFFQNSFYILFNYSTR